MLRQVVHFYSGVYKDNDGDYNNNIKSYAKVYKACSFIKFFSPKDDNQYSLEPAMIAANAKAIVVSKNKRRTVPVENIVTGPGETSLAKGEVIEAITLPKRPAKSGDAYLRFIPRTEMDIAVVSAGVNLTLERGVVKTARVVLGAVGPTALLVRDAAKAIIGTKLDDAAMEKLAAACSAACRPIDDKRGTIEYRTKVAGVLGRRAAKIAYQRAGGA